MGENKNTDTGYYNSKIENYAQIILTATLLSALIIGVSGFSKTGSYAIISIVYGLIGATFIIFEKKLYNKKKYTVLFVVFVSIVFFRSILSFQLADIIRLVALLSFTSVNLYLIPSLVSLNTFLRVTSWVSAVIIIIGLLPYIGVPTQIGFIDLSFWTSISTNNYQGVSALFFDNLPDNIYVITSVFINPNQLGGLSLAGTIAALGYAQITKSPLMKGIFLVNLLGLFLSRYRAGWAAFFVAVGLYTSYEVAGSRGLRIAFYSVISSIAITLLMMFSLIPGPEFLTEVGLNGRRELWATSVRALREQPFIGYGFSGVSEVVGNPHSTYFRMFSAFGLLGGIIYLVLSLGTTVGSVRETVSMRGLTLAMLLTAMFLIQITNQLSFVGISLRSSLIAISMGYYISNNHSY